MLTSGSGSRIASHAQSLTGIYSVACLDGNAAQVHVGTLILAAVISVVFYSYRQSTCSIRIVVDLSDLALVFRCQYIVMLGLNVDALVHLRVGRIERIFSHAER